VPPLRERKDDVPLLADYFLRRYTQMYNRDPMKLSPKLLELFLNYSWPGNVRELENNVKRFIILGNESQLITEMQRKRETGQYSAVPDDFQSPAAEVVTTSSPRNTGRAPTKEPAPVAAGKGGDPNAWNLSAKATLKEVSKIAQRNAEKGLIEKVLLQTRWNRRKAAQILDISYKALLYKIKDCGLTMD
jgi:two-component system response regulator AtoC